MSARVSIVVDGRTLSAEAGIPLGAVLHGEREGILRSTPRTGAPRGIFCGMGVCFDCAVTVDGRPGVRACLTPVRAGMEIETGRP